MRWLKTDLLGTAFQFLWRMKEQNSVGKHRAWPKRRKLLFGKTQCFLLTFCQGGDVTNQIQVYCLSAIYGKQRNNRARDLPVHCDLSRVLGTPKMRSSSYQRWLQRSVSSFLLYFVLLCYTSYFLSVKSKDRNVHGILNERKHMISPFVQSPQSSQR